VILYDEPTTGLDPANSRRIGELIVSLRDRLGVTSVIVTHELELCFTISDRVALLKDGRLVACDTAERIRTSTDPAVRSFLEGGGSLEADSVWLTREDEAGSDAVEAPVESGSVKRRAAQGEDDDGA
jgi:phospholipid/cholesterol/gamma-HCH transport system ATP-binding protein